MKGLLAATAVLGVLAIGGLPTLALTLADNETGADTAAQVDSADQPGPPPWAHGHAKGHQKDGKPAKKDKAGRDEQGAGGDGRPGWARNGGQVPPGWAKNHPGRSPHGWAMRDWAHCLADAAGELGQGEKLDVEAVCGARPAHPKGNARR